MATSIAWALIDVKRFGHWGSLSSRLRSICQIWHSSTRKTGYLIHYFVSSLGRDGASCSDLMSYLLFTSKYTRELVEFGYHDASERIQEIEDFLYSSVDGDAATVCQFLAEKALLQPDDERRQNKTGSHTLEAKLKGQSTCGFAFNNANCFLTPCVACS
jgi:hypothetical protein